MRRWVASLPLTGARLLSVEVADAGRLFGPALSRLSRLEVWPSGPGVLDALAESPHQGGLGELRLGFPGDVAAAHAEPDWYASELGRLLRSPLAGRLRCLGLRLTSEAAVEALAGAELPALARLEVDLATPNWRGYRDGDTGERLARVLASPGLPGVRRLVVSGLQPAPRLSLAGPVSGRLEALSIFYEPDNADCDVWVPLDGIDGLTPALAELRLHNATVPETGLEALAASPTVVGLRHLHLGLTGHVPVDPRRLAALVDPARVESFAVQHWGTEELDLTGLRAAFGDRLLDRRSVADQGEQSATPEELEP